MQIQKFKNPQGLQKKKSFTRARGFHQNYIPQNQYAKQGQNKVTLYEEQERKV